MFVCGGQMTTFLYRFFDGDGQLLYVGISYHLERRLDSHRYAKPWARIARIELEQFATRAEAATAERRAIETEKPEWNVIFASGTPLLCVHCNCKLILYFRWEGNAYCSDCWAKLDLPPPVERPRRQASYRKQARARWSNADSVIGDGRFASLAHCRVLTVHLYESEDAALKAKKWIDRCGCGGFCTGDHEIVDLDKVRV